jgi:hypothetical protein
LEIKNKEKLLVFRIVSKFMKENKLIKPKMDLGFYYKEEFIFIWVNGLKIKKMDLE